MDIDIQKVAEKVITGGPARVVINVAGEAVPPMRAKRDHGIVPAIVFIRNDGWTLGAPEQFAQVAEALWKDQWVGYMKRPSRVAKPYPR